MYSPDYSNKAKEEFFCNSSLKIVAIESFDQYCYRHFKANRKDILFFSLSGKKAPEKNSNK